MWILLTESRIFNEEDPHDMEMAAKFADALSFPDKKGVKQHNAERTEELRKRNPNIYNIKALDLFADGNKFDQRCPDNLIPNNDRFTAGIPSNIQLGVGSRVMLIRNKSLMNGLVNGSVGTVVGLKWTALRDEQLQDEDLPEAVIIRFDGDAGGAYRDLNGYVKIDTVTFEFVGNR
ncbi:ATP-dependent DNA helicase PIF5 [Folsomia candida]|uniref:ATP-dependent DNA helicase PIF5 n=1 Tax=Folsomia candida TaxID=158441 RepID=A0A226D3X7_FOLCA|nr:ATP-dependent DNA helicase PIF5 [Folsomia candida]